MPSNKNAVIRYMYLDQMLSFESRNEATQEQMKQVRRKVLEYIGQHT